LSPAENAELLPRQIHVEHLGPLRALLDPSDEVQALTPGFAEQGLPALADRPRRQLRPHLSLQSDGAASGFGDGAVELDLPSVQALLGGEQVGPDALLQPPDGIASPASLDGEGLSLPSTPAAGVAVLPPHGAADPFRPYVPKEPSQLSRAFSAELAGLLSGQPTSDDAAVDEDENRYDSQTAQVAGVLRRSLAQHTGQALQMTLDDMIPPSSTDKAVAARTFSALLTLATAGELRVEQGFPYGPIVISQL